FAMVDGPMPRNRRVAGAPGEATLVPYLGTPPEGSLSRVKPVQGCHVQRLRTDAPAPCPVAPAQWFRLAQQPGRPASPRGARPLPARQLRLDSAARAH